MREIKSVTKISDEELETVIEVRNVELKKDLLGEEERLLNDLDKIRDKLKKFDK